MGYAIHHIGHLGRGVRGNARQRAQANSRWQRVVQYSIDGLTLDEVIQELGTNKQAFKSYLRDHAGNSNWPVDAEHHPKNAKISMTQHI